MIILRTSSVFIPGNGETIINYDCVPSYSQTLTAEIINMDNNVLIPQTSLKSGKIITIICKLQSICSLITQFETVTV